jgi:hypothetical protein
MHPTQRLSVILTAQEWNNVMALLGEQPFKIAAPLIGQIQSQCEAHAQLLEAQAREDADYNDKVISAQAQADARSVPGQARTKGGKGPNRATPLRVVDDPALGTDAPAAS